MVNDTTICLDVAASCRDGVVGTSHDAPTRVAHFDDVAACPQWLVPAGGRDVGDLPMSDELVTLRARKLTRGPKEEGQYQLGAIKTVAMDYLSSLSPASGERPTSHVVAISGGADSTWMTLELIRRYPDRKFLLFCTPTGDEYADMLAHWDRIECIFKQPIHRVGNRDMDYWIRFFNALPNFRMRWCARLLKLVPCQALITILQQVADVVLYVGLRADEMDREGVIYEGSATECYPMQEWGHTLATVRNGLREAGITIPKRSDCRKCFWQRIGEWYDFWRRDPDGFQESIDYETLTGQTFLSPGKFANWPHRLEDLRAEFIRGRIPLGTSTVQVPLFGDEQTPNSCRLCRM